jgi:putative salt-induced outer membrane protein
LRRALPFVLVTLLFPVHAAAQAAAPPPPPPRHEGTAEVAFVGVTGNASTSTFSAGGEYITRPTSWVVRNRVQFVRNESEDILTAESFLYLFRAEKTLTRRLAAFGEYAFFRDEFAGVAHRNAVNGGLAIKIVDLEKHLFTTDVSLGYLNEDRLTGDDVSSATYGTGAHYRWKISPTATFEEDLRFTGTFARAADWRLGNIVSVTTQLTDLFSLKVSNTVRYSHLPPPGFKTTDTTTSIALVAKFTRQ